jgi:hypothetical protein
MHTYEEAVEDRLAGDSATSAGGRRADIRSGSRRAVAFNRRAGAGLRRGLALLLAIGALVAGAGQALAQAAEQQPAPDPAVVEQKFKLLENVLSSPRMSQIAAGRDAEGALLVDRARRAAEEARGARAAGDLQGAAALLDQALKACSAASLRVGRSAEEDAHLRARNRETLEQVRSYRASLGEAAKERGDDRVTAELARIDQMVIRTFELGAANRHADAARVLREAYDLAVELLSELRAGHSMVVARRFDTPAEELAHERRAYDENLALVQRMMREYRIDPDRREHVERHMADSLRYRTQSDDLAGRGDSPAAIRVLEQANDQLLKAVMTASGLTSY